MISDQVMRRLRFNTESEFVHPRVSKVVRAAGEIGLVILIDCYSFFQKNNVEKLLYLAYANRETNFVFAHMGGAEFQKLGFLGELSKTNPWFATNIWVDISATINIFANSPYKEQLKWTIKSIGIDKVLFGSDFPQYSVNKTIASLKSLNLTKEEQRKIMFFNAKKLLGL